VMYSLIQFLHAVTLYARGGAPGDLQYLYVDVMITIPFVLVMAMTPATSRLRVSAPHTSLCTPRGLIGLLCQCGLAELFQQIVVMLVIRQWWYEPIDPAGSDAFSPPFDVDGKYFTQSFTPTNLTSRQHEPSMVTLSHLGTYLFLFVNFQYVAVAIALNLGDLHRRPFYRNPAFVVIVVVALVLNCLLLLAPNSVAANLMELRLTTGPNDTEAVPKQFRSIIMGLVCTYMILAISMEQFLSSSMMTRIFAKC